LKDRCFDSVLLPVKRAPPFLLEFGGQEEQRRVVTNSVRLRRFSLV